MINLMEAIQLRSLTLEYKVSCQTVKCLNKRCPHLSEFLAPDTKWAFNKCLLNQ